MAEWPLPFVEVVIRSEEHTSELQSHDNLVCRLLLEKKIRRHAPPRPRPLLPRRHTHAGARCRARPRARSTARPRTPRATLLFFNDTATTEIYTLSLHDALPISVVI